MAIYFSNSLAPMEFVARVSFSFLFFLILILIFFGVCVCVPVFKFNNFIWAYLYLTHTTCIWPNTSVIAIIMYLCTLLWHVEQGPMLSISTLQWLICSCSFAVLQNYLYHQFSHLFCLLGTLTSNIQTIQFFGHTLFTSFLVYCSLNG